MARIRLIHGSLTEAAAHAVVLRRRGYQVDTGPVRPKVMTAMRRDPPDAIIIDLSRAPSQGRDIAMALRSARATRACPLLFVDGEAEKVKAIRAILPDARFTSGPRLTRDLADAIAHPPKEPVATRSAFAAYASVPTARKLGIKEGSKIVLIGAPDGIEKALGPLPEGATLRRAQGARDLTLWFPRSRGDLLRNVARMGKLGANGGLWILWPKKASGIDRGLDQVVVRKAGLASGLVDFKISSIDATWSGLRFTRRR